MFDRLLARSRSRVLRVTLPTAGGVVAIQHGLGVTPTGFLVIWADGPVYAASAVTSPWTDVLAFLRAPNANTHALVVFYSLNEEVVDAP